MGIGLSTFEHVEPIVLAADCDKVEPNVPAACLLGKGKCLV